MRARSTSCPCASRAARAGRCGPRRPRWPCPSTWPRSARPTCGCAANWPTAGWGTRSCRRRPRCSWTRCGAAAARAGGPLAARALQVPVAVEFTDDVAEAEARHAAGYAFTIGAMGSGAANFYNEAFARQGFGDQVRAVQQLWQARRRDEAARAVPRALGARTNLLGPAEVVRARLRLYRDAGVNTLAVKLRGSLGERVV